MAMGELWPLGAFALVSTITPGGATALATASGVHFGFRRSLPLMTGIVTGLTTMAAAASLGLAGLLLAQPSMQTLMKALGSAYMLWLAWKIGRSGPPNLQAHLVRPTRFLGGVAVLWYSPKAWTMTLGAAASFATLVAEPVQRAALLGVTFGLAAATSVSVWCLSGQLLARRLRTERQWHLVNALLGLLLLASVIPLWL